MTDSPYHRGSEGAHHHALITSLLLTHTQQQTIGLIDLAQIENYGRPSETTLFARLSCRVNRVGRGGGGGERCQGDEGVVPSERWRIKATRLTEIRVAEEPA